MTVPACKQYWRNIGPISTYWVHIGQYYNIGPMLVQYWITINSGKILMQMI